MSAAEQLGFDLSGDANKWMTEEMRERFVKIAKELAARVYPAGITAENIRREAVKRGLLTGEESGRKLSFLGTIPKSAGLVSTGQYMRSSIKKSHGNLHAVWRKADD